MSELAALWRFTRARLAQAIEGLTDAQLNWRMFAGAHSIAEYLYHVAGAELYWAHHLGGWQPADEFEAGVLACTRDSFLNDAPFPLAASLCNTTDVHRALNLSYAQLAPIIDSPTPEQLAKPVRSPIGDPIDGREGLIRVAQHPAYHTGQIWLIRMHPEFPSG
ncbi:MAG: DinB family protein [Fimbriimonadales bacterium]|nr:DinB family protein [Fimbriimonadales bacterium]